MKMRNAEYNLQQLQENIRLAGLREQELHKTNQQQWGMYEALKATTDKQAYGSTAAQMHARDTAQMMEMKLRQSQTEHLRAESESERKDIENQKKIDELEDEISDLQARYADLEWGNNDYPKEETVDKEIATTEQIIPTVTGVIPSSSIVEGNLPQSAGGNLLPAPSCQISTTQALKELLTVKKEPIHHRIGTPEPEVKVKLEPTTGTFGGPTAPVPREANSINFEALPNASDYQDWERKIGKKVAALSNRPELCFKWWLELRQAKAVEELEESGDFGSWDIKVGSGLTDILKGEFAKKI